MAEEVKNANSLGMFGELSNLYLRYRASRRGTEAQLDQPSKPAIPVPSATANAAGRLPVAGWVIAAIVGGAVLAVVVVKKVVK
jgi:hypothetical protein